MLPGICILVGSTGFVFGIYWLWYMLARPEQWTRFTVKDYDFWVKRGLPVKLVGACKEFEQGRGLKLLVAFGIVYAVILVIAPFVLAYLPRHR